MTWNIAESPKISQIIGKFGLKQGANVKNQKGLKSFRTDICKYDLFNLHCEKFKLLERTYIDVKLSAKEY